MTSATMLQTRFKDLHMTPRYRDTRKIDPKRGDTLGDGTPTDNDRIEIGPTQLAFGECATRMNTS